MRQIFLRSIILLFLTVASFCVSADTLLIPGSGSPEVILRELADAFNAGNHSDKVEILPSARSAGGIRLIKNNEAIMARVSRRPMGEDAEGLHYLPFVRDAVVFATGEQVSIKGLSAQQLADIFSGKLSNWNQVGGAPAPIRVLVRNQEESNHKIIKEHLAPFKNLTITPQAKMAYHSHEMIELLDKFSTGIGYVSYSSVESGKTKLHALELDDIPPTPENVLSGKYPIVIDYGLIYKEERLNNVARKFIDFVFSEPGRKIMRENGLIPLIRKPL